jgi:hypothetical protein
LRTAARAGRLALLPLGLALALPGGGCGGSGARAPSGAELTLERRQFVLVSEGLRVAAPSVKREVTAARATWPMLAEGLPTSSTPALRLSIARAAALAKALPAPGFMARASRLTGPAAGLAGLYESFMRLCERAWRLTQASLATIAGGPPTAARFARENSPLYIDAIYDSHFNLSLIGKSLTGGYTRLGGPGVFGATLPRAEVDALAAAYSIAAVRLTPHPGPRTELR